MSVVVYNRPVNNQDRVPRGKSLIFSSFSCSPGSSFDSDRLGNERIVVFCLGFMLWDKVVAVLNLFNGLLMRLESSREGRRIS
jgi:hypothetical protein